MISRRFLHQSINSLMIVLTLVWPIVQPLNLHAADFYWDSNGLDGDNLLDGTGLGGNGTWDTAGLLWWPVPSGADVVYGNGTNDRAIFTGPVGPGSSVVTVSSGIQANRLSFYQSGYVLTGGDLTLSGSVPSIDVNHGDTARINTQILGSNGLVKAGGGALRLGNAANSYTGVTRINGGSIVIGSNGALGADTSAIVVSGSAARGFPGGQLVLDGTSGAVTLSRNISLQGFGPISDRSGALASVRDNTITGAVSSGVGAINTRFNSSSGFLTFTGGLDAGGTLATTLTQLGNGNQAGSNNFAITGPLTGVGILEKTGSGTLVLNSSDSSAFSGTVRVTSSANSILGSVRITSNGTLGSRTAAANQSVIDLNSGTLEVRMDAPLVGITGGVNNANTYVRASSTVFLDHSVGGTAINGVANFGALSYDAGITPTWNGRNGYGATYTTANVNTNTGNSVFANNLNGNLTFTGNFWGNTNAVASRTVTLQGSGNTILTGNLVGSSTAGNFSFVKSGSGSVTITSAGSTLDGNVTVSQGALTLADFRSIGNPLGTYLAIDRTINLGGTTNAGVLNIGGTTTAATAAGLTTGNRTINLSGTTGGATINALQTQAFPVQINGTMSATGLGNKTLTLGGTSIQQNTFNSVIPNSTGFLTSVTKADAGTWILQATNTYTGNTTLTGGSLQAQAIASVSDIINNASAINFDSNPTTQTAGGNFSLRAVSNAPTTETFGQLNATNGATTVSNIINGSGAANIVFGSLGVVGRGSGVNFDRSSAANGTIVLTGVAATNASTLLGNGHFYLNGDSFPRVNTSNTALVVPVYGVNAGFENAAAALSTGNHNLVTGNIVAQPAISITSLKLNSNTLALAGNLSVNTAGVNNDGGILVNGTSTISGANIGTGGAGTLVFRVNKAADSLTLASPMGNTTTGGFTKNGAGNLILQGANNQMGATTINEGTVTLSGSGRLSDNNQPLVIRQSGLLDLGGVGSGNAISSLDGSGTITNNGATATLSIGNSDGGGTFAGTIQSGSGTLNLLKRGSVTSTLSGINTYTGITTIESSGVLATPNLANFMSPSGIGTGNSTTNAASLVFAGTTGALSYTGTNSISIDRLFTFNGNGNATTSGAQISSNSPNQSALIFNNTGALAFGVSANVPQTLTLAGTSTGDSVFNPQITNNGALKTGVEKINGGTWYLGGASNTYSGNTTITAGALGASDGTSLPNTSPLIIGSGNTNAGVFLSQGNFVRNISDFANATTNTVTFNTTAGTGGGFAAGSSKLVVALGGVGTETPLTWGAGGFVGTGNSSQSLLLSHANALSEVEIRNPIDLGSGFRTIQVDDNTNAATDFATISGVLSGAGGGVNKTGNSLLQLFGLNTYTGNTTLNAGTLVVNSLGNSALGAGGSSLGERSTGNTQAGALHLGNGTTAAGILQYVGPGETSDRMIRLNTTTANSQIHADGSGALVLTNVLNDLVAGNKTLLLRGSNTAGNAISSNLTDFAGTTLGVTVDGGASWILSGANSYTGATTVSQGALGIGSATALGSSTLVLSNGSVFAAYGDQTISTPTQHSNNAPTAFIGDNNLTINTLTELAVGTAPTITNGIADGKTLTLGAVTMNAITASRTLTILGSGSTVLGSFSSATPAGTGPGGPVFSKFPTPITLNGIGNSSLTLTSAGADFNTGALTVTNGTLRIGASEVIPHGFLGQALVTANNAVVANTTLTLDVLPPGLAVGQLLTGTGIPAGSTIIDIAGNDITVLGNASTVAINAPLTIAPTGNVILNPGLGQTARLDLNGNSESINGLTSQSAGSAFIDNTVASTSSTLTVGESNQNVNFGGAGGGINTIQNSGAGSTLNLAKNGTGTANFTGTLAYTGSTTSNFGTLNLNSPAATTSLTVGQNGTLKLVGGLTTPSSLTSIVVAASTTPAFTGGTLSLASGLGQVVGNLTTLSLGVGTGTTFLELDAGDSGTDTLTLLSNVATANNLINFIIKDIDLSNTTGYDLLVAPGGGLTSGGATYSFNLSGYTGSSLFTSDNLVRLNTGTLITNNVYWNGGTVPADLSWATIDGTLSTNFSNSTGTVQELTLPGKGQKVIFTADSFLGGTNLNTTLDASFKINALEFQVSAKPTTNFALSPGVVTSNSLNLVPSSSADGIRLVAGGPATVAISAPIVVGGNQTWTTGNSTQLLTVSAPIQGTGFDVSKEGDGTLRVTGAADTTFNTLDTMDFIVKNGTLEVTNAAGLGSVANGNIAGVTIGNGTPGNAAYFYNNATTGTIANNLTLNGGTLSAGGNAHTYSGLINIASNSTVNLRDSNQGTGNLTSRAITLSNTVSGPGRLTVDSVETLSSNNTLTGTLQLNGNNVAWSGGIGVLRGTIIGQNATSLGTGTQTFIGISPTLSGNTSLQGGRIINRGLNGETTTYSNGLNYNSATIGEYQVSNLSGTVSTNPALYYTVNQNGTLNLGTSGGNGTGVIARFLLANTGSALNFNGPANLNGNSSVSVAGGNTSLAAVTFANGINEVGGSFSLALNDDAGVWGQTNTRIAINGASNYTGGTTISEGTLMLGNQNALGNGTLGILGASRLEGTVNLSGANSLPNALSLAANLTVAGNNSITFNNGTTVNSGAARTITNSITGGGLLTLAGNSFLSNNATNGALTIAGAANTTLAGDIADSNGSGGAGALTVTNSGITTLTGNNSYSNTTTMNAAAGTLVAQGTNSSAGNTTLTAGKIQLNNAANGGLASGQLTLTAGVLEPLIATTLSNNATISGTVAVNGTQNLTLSNTLTQTGGNRALNNNLVGSTLRVENLRLSDSVTGRTLTVGGNGTTVIGTLVNSISNSTITSSIGSAGSLTIDTGVSIAETATVGQTVTFAGAGNTTISGVVSNGAGSGGNLTKTGAGTLFLNNTNTYTGTTTLDAASGNTQGVISAGANNALGTGPAILLYNTGALTAQLQLTSGITLNNSNFTTTGAGNATGISGIIRSVSGSNVITGNLSLTGGGGSSTYRADLGSSLAFNGNVGAVSNTTRDVFLVGGGDFSFGGTVQNSNQLIPGTLDKINLSSGNTGNTTLSGTNTYTGTTSVLTGSTLIAGSGQAFGVGSAVTVNGTMRLAGNSNTIGTLAGDGLLENANAGPATLTVGSSGSTTFSGVAQNGAGGGALSLSKTAAGILSLTNANTYTGSTSVTGGSIAVSSSGSTVSPALTVGSAGTFTSANSTANSALASGATVSNDGVVSFAGNQTISTLNGTNGAATLAQTGTLTVSGGGTYAGAINGSGASLDVTGSTLNLNGVSGYTGSTSVGANTLNIGAAGSLASTSLSVGANGTFTSANTGANTALASGSPLLNNGAITLAGAQTLSTLNGTNTASTLDTNGLLTVTNGGGYSGAINGAGGLTVSGNMTLDGTSANTYSGVTNVTSGTLSLNKTAGTNAIVGDGVSSKTIADVIIGSGGVVKLLANNQLDNSAYVSITAGGTFNRNGKTETIYNFSNVGGTYASGRGGSFTIIDPTWGIGSTNDILAAETYGNLEIAGGSNTIHGDELSNFGGGSVTVQSGGLLFNGTSSPSLVISSDNGSQANAGKLILQGNVAFTGASGTASIVNGNVLLDAGGPGPWTNTGNLGAFNGQVDLGNATRTFTIDNGSAAVDMSISAEITSATGALTKEGLGTLLLNGPNNYDGGTTVNAGRLVVNGNQSAANGAFIVDSAGTLAGNGTIGGFTSITGTHSPGLNSADKQTFTNNLVYETGSNLSWDLFTNGNSTGFDTIAVTGGALTIGPGVTSNLVFNTPGSTVNFNDSFWTSNQIWEVYSNANAPFFLDPAGFSAVNLTNDSNGISLASVQSGAFFAWDIKGQNVYLNYLTAVPEPASFGGAFVLLGSWFARRRRNRNKKAKAPVA